MKPGDLLVQIDTRDVQNQYDQARADVTAARGRELEVSPAQKKRTDELFKTSIITAAGARDGAARLRQRAGRDRPRAHDARHRASSASRTRRSARRSPARSSRRPSRSAPVITSATGAVGGGTTLLKMADLTRVRMRALFNETDIGQVRLRPAGDGHVDAYPGRRFTGIVEKIEPQAVVQQNVTMFPVLVTLQNREGLLKPGMNGEVSVLVDQRTNVLAVPNDAVRNARGGGHRADARAERRQRAQRRARRRCRRWAAARRRARRQVAGGSRDRARRRRARAAGRAGWRRGRRAARCPTSPTRSAPP